MIVLVMANWILIRIRCDLLVLISTKSLTGEWWSIWRCDWDRPAYMLYSYSNEAGIVCKFFRKRNSFNITADLSWKALNDATNLLIKNYTKNLNVIL